MDCVAKSPAAASNGMDAHGARWRALFVSDVHLQPNMLRTTEAFLGFLGTHARRASALYLLGDLFEYWAGDDDIDSPYPRSIVAAIREVTDAGVAVYWIAGNRDFLVGERFAAEAGVTLLPDPSIVSFDGQPVILSHGDAACTDDAAYMQFRALVRSPAWQQQFLSMPLDERKQAIEGMRLQSKAALRNKPAEIMDVNEDEIAVLFECAQSRIIIHGHTHRPAGHLYGEGESSRARYVLPDWDCDATPPRGGWISIDFSGVVRRHTLDGSEIVQESAR
ncbi:MAG: lpxH [Herminiimonas sp.]|nr:lpxH [Herminiimonas sp.]MDB5854829.1 lpxH [Herminiimonas sp.]